MNSYQNYSLHINLHILLIILVKESLKIQESTKILYLHQKIHTKQFFNALFNLFCICNTFEFKQLGFSGEPMTQYTHESHANMNPVRT